VKDTNKNFEHNILSIPVIIIILIITFIAYLPSLENGFVDWDDNHYVKLNNDIKELSVTNLKKMFTSYYVSTYLPLTMVFYSIEYSVFKLNPAGYHWVNLILHLINCILVYILIFIISRKNFIAFVVSILFGIHTLHVESVAWIAELKDVLYSVFFLGTIISYIYYRQKLSKKLYFISVSLFLLSVLSKGVAVTAPVILILIDYYLDRNNSSVNRNLNYLIRSIKNKIPFFIIALIFIIIGFYGQQESELVKEKNFFDFIQNISNMCYGILFYIIKMVAPIKLSCIYPETQNLENGLKLLYTVAPAVVMGISILLYVIRKYIPKFLFGLLFYLITIAPVIQFIPIGRAIPADRYFYIPSIGLFYIFAEIIYYVKTKYKGLIKICSWSLLILILFILTILTYQRCKVWKDGLTLTDDVIQNYKNIPVVYYNRGLIYSEKKEYDKAINEYGLAIKYKPTYFAAYNNRGNLYSNLGKYDEAISDFTEAINIKPGYIKAYHNRATAYFFKGDYDKAISDYSKAIELDTTFFPSYYNRILCYIKKGDYRSAEKDIDKLKSIGYNIDETKLFKFRNNKKQ